MTTKRRCRRYPGLRDHHRRGPEHPKSQTSTRIGSDVAHLARLHDPGPAGSRTGWCGGARLFRGGVTVVLQSRPLASRPRSDRCGAPTMRAAVRPERADRGRDPALRRGERDDGRYGRSACRRDGRRGADRRYPAHESSARSGVALPPLPRELNPDSDRRWRHASCLLAPSSGRCVRTVRPDWIGRFPCRRSGRRNVVRQCATPS